MLVHLHDIPEAFNYMPLQCKNTTVQLTDLHINVTYMQQHSLTQTLKHTLQFQAVAPLLVIQHSYIGGQTLCWNLLSPYSRSTMKTETASSSTTSPPTYMAILSLDPEDHTRTCTDTKMWLPIHLRSVILQYAVCLLSMDDYFNSPRVEQSNQCWTFKDNKGIMEVRIMVELRQEVTSWPADCHKRLQYVTFKLLTLNN